MTITVDLKITPGDVLRFALLSSHYRSKCEIGDKALAQARKTLRRLALACEPTLAGPPVEFIETLCNDLNTPGAFALLHTWRAQGGRGKDIFAALRFLGFFGATCLPDEIKTLPEDHIWQADYVGLVHAGEA